MLGSIILVITHIVFIWERLLRFLNISKYNSVWQEDKFLLQTDLDINKACVYSDDLLGYSVEREALEFQDLLSSSPPYLVIFTITWTFAKIAFTVMKIKAGLRVILTNTVMFLQFIEIFFDILAVGVCSQMFVLIFDRCIRSPLSANTYFSQFTWAYAIIMTVAFIFCLRNFKLLLKLRARHNESMIKFLKFFDILEKIGMGAVILSFPFLMEF